MIDKIKLYISNCSLKEIQGRSRYGGLLKRYAVNNFGDAVKCLAADWVLRLGLFPFYFGRRLKKGSLLHEHNKPQRVLVLRPDGLGDVIFLIPMLRALRSILPDADIFVGAKTAYVDFMHENPYGIKSLPLDLPWFNRERITIGKLLEFATIIRQFRFNIAFDPRGDIRNRLLLFLAGIPRRIGSSLRGGEYMLTDVINAPNDEDFVLQNLRQLEALTQVQKGGRLELWVTKRGEEEALKFLQRWKIYPGIRYCTIFPFSFYPAKDWPIKNYSRLIKGLVAKTGIRPIICCTSDEIIFAKQILELSSSTGAILAEALTVSGIISLVVRSQLVIGSCSAGVNIGAALGIPTLAMYGPGHPSLIGTGRWAIGPFLALRNEPECPPCFRYKAPPCLKNNRNTVTNCMAAINVSEVLVGALKLLKLTN